jgi:chromate reductase
MRILGISGSLRRDSTNTRLLTAAARELPEGVEMEVFDGLAEVPPYDEDADADGASAAVTRLREAIAGADALLISTPEYNFSIPGQLKNALDWASRPYPGNCVRYRPAAVMGASRGQFGAVWAQAELRKVLGAMGARVIDAELPLGRSHEGFAEDGRVRDPELREQLRALVGRLVEEARPARTAA